MNGDSIELKWGEKALSLGWTSVPTSLFFLQSNLRISQTAFVVLLNLIVHWWKIDEWPHPSIASLASRMGTSERTVQRALTELESKELIKKIATKSYSSTYRGRNIYDLTGLIMKLDHLGLDIAHYIKGKNYKDSK